VSAPSHPRTASRAAIIIGSVVFGTLGALSLIAILQDAPNDGDPAWMFYGLPVLAMLLALAAFSLNRRARYALPALIASLLCLTLFWILVVLFAG